MKEFASVHTSCGLTNITYRLLKRGLVNRDFLVAVIVDGLDSASVDPTDKMHCGFLKSSVVIDGKGEFCMDRARPLEREGLDKGDTLYRCSNSSCDIVLCISRSVFLPGIIFSTGTTDTICIIAYGYLLPLLSPRALRLSGSYFSLLLFQGLGAVSC